MIDVGLVGCGAVVHEMYAKVLFGRDEYAVRYTTDLDAAQARSAAELLGGEAVGFDVLAQNADAVIVTTPPSSHASIVRSCLREGRVILCEKPFVTSHAEAAALTAEAEAAGTRLHVGQFRRTFPQLELARDLVAMGLIGDITGISVSEGGRFTWKAVSDYTTRDPRGGVLWDTGAHSVDMVLFASGLDREQDVELADVKVERDKAEPSHDFLADFVLRAGGRDVQAHVHVSRLEALPNIARVTGTGGSVAISTGMDTRVRLTTPKGSKVLVAERSHVDLVECLDVQIRRVLLGDGADAFAARNFVGQIKILEDLADA